MEVGLGGQVVVVTGAASGIGEAVARLAAASGAAALLLTDRDAAGLARVGAELGAGGARVATIAADLLDPAAPRSVARAAREAFGRIDGLVNAAGLTTRASMLDGTAAVWDDLFAVNARAPYFLMQEVLRDLTGRGAPGAVVNILSMNAHCGIPELAIYAASKGALLTLTKNAAHAHLRDRVRVNGINLGWVDTPAERVMQAQTLGKGEGWLAAAAAGMPLGRLLAPEEAARLAVWLLSEASAPMTGVCVDLEQRVTGGPA